ncbi:MAG: hypothetical protein OXC80_06725 [Gammaproteobacteria bacterium]|nr:hypothetical protein [Gammaproteobacteria bacterium]
MSDPNSILEWIKNGEYNQGVIQGGKILVRMLGQIERHNCVVISAYPEGDAEDSEELSREYIKSNKNLESWLMRHFATSRLEGYGIYDKKVDGEVNVAFFASNREVEGDDGGKMFRQVAEAAKYFKQEAFIGTVPKSNEFHLYQSPFETVNNYELKPSGNGVEITRLEDLEDHIKDYMYHYGRKTPISKNGDDPDSLSSHMKLHAFRCHPGTFFGNLAYVSRSTSMDNLLFRKPVSKLLSD